MADRPIPDLNDLPAFAAVAELGSFTQAAERLGSTKARVSQQVRRLETALGLELFHRTTRRVSLTEPGHALVAGSLPHLRQALDALGQLTEGPAGKGGAAALSGTLRISCTVDHAAQSLARHLVDFSALHPRLDIDLRSSDRVVDLVRDGIDVALRMGWLPDSSLRAVKLGSFQQVVVASPAYLQRVGPPRRPQDLAALDWVALTLLPAPLTWRFTGPRRAVQTVRVSTRLRTDSAASLRALLEAGAGIGVLDEPGARLALQQGRLQRVLGTWALPEGGMYAVYPPGRHIPRPVQAFVDFYRERLAAR